MGHGSQKQNGQGSSGTGDQSKKDDWDLDAPPKVLDKVPSVPKVGLPGSAKWSSLFGVNPIGKSSFLSVKILLEAKKGSCAIAISDELMDHIIKSMASTLFGKFLGPR